jgi:hypothetical protein
MTTDTNTTGYEIGDEILVLAHRMTLAVLRDDGAAFGVAYGDFIAKREGCSHSFLTHRGSPTTLTDGVATVTRAERTSSLV